MTDHPFKPYPADRFPESCVQCGKPPADHPFVKRDREAEARLLELGVRAAVPPQSTLQQDAEIRASAKELTSFAERRIGVGTGAAIHSEYIWLPPGRNLIRDAAEEVADAGPHYCTFAASLAEPGMMAGDHDAEVQYRRAMNALPHLIRAWHALHD